MTAGARGSITRRGTGWTLRVDVGRGPDGRRRQVRRSGFATRRDAQAALTQLLGDVRAGAAPAPGTLTVAAYLLGWLDDAAAGGLRPATVISYRGHLLRYIVPALGRIRLSALTPADVEAFIRRLRTTPGGRGRPLSAASVRRVHATLRTALAAAVRSRRIPYNPAAGVALPAAARPKVRPWAPEELGAFLDHAQGDELGALFEVLASTGMRRGEVVGLQWGDVDLAAARLTVWRTISARNGRHACPHCTAGHLGLAWGAPKTSAGEGRVVDLDAATVGVLLAHRLRQDVLRAAAGAAWTDHQLVFADAHGGPLQPATVSARFGQLTDGAGLRRTRLHDLRHAQASNLLAAGVDVALVSRRLGHSSIRVTVDSYAHLLGSAGRVAAEAASALIPRRVPALVPGDPPTLAPRCVDVGSAAGQTSAASAA